MPAAKLFHFDRNVLSSLHFDASGVARYGRVSDSLSQSQLLFKAQVDCLQCNKIATLQGKLPKAMISRFPQTLAVILPIFAVIFLQS